MQLNLFPATILAFPPVRRHQLVMETVQGLLRKDYGPGRTFWAKTVRKLRREMAAAGIAPSIIETEITKFSLAVRYHVLAAEPAVHQPDGAA